MKTNQNKSMLKDGKNKQFIHPKNKKGITLIALVVTIVVLLILAGVSISMLSGENGILTKAQDSKTESLKGQEKELITLAYTGAQIQKSGNQITSNELNNQFIANGTKATAKGTGTITVTFSDTGNIYKISPNGEITFFGVSGGNKIVADDLGIEPKIGEDMIPVKYDDATGNWVEADSSIKGDWFDYTKKQWANVETENGYFVYIPRFAYKITDGYHKSLQESAGTIAIVFLNSDNTLKTSTDSEGNAVSQSDLIHASEVTSSVDETTNEVKTGKNATTNYIIHPAFEAFDTAEKKVDGLWVSKYEMSMEETTDGGATWQSVSTTDSSIGDILLSEDTTKRMVAKAGVSSWSYMQVNKIFENCYNMNRAVDSHMMKDSEWGAVVYLAVSKYGKGAIDEVETNKSSSYLTGHGEDGTLSTGAASTTGNMYGIFDMAGGRTEYMAAYVDDECVQKTETEEGDWYKYNKRLIEETQAKYKDVYTIGATNMMADCYAANNLRAGNATWETSGNVGNPLTWFKDFSYFAGVSGMLHCPIVIRGGSGNSYGPSFGIFYTDGTSGKAGSSGFRVVCIGQ